MIASEVYAEDLSTAPERQAEAHHDVVLHLQPREQQILVG